MNTSVTSKDAILHSCRELVSENGLASLNMRKVAQKCNVALGSIYNYFPSKRELTIATIESVWQNIFHMENHCGKEMSFPDYVQWVFEMVNDGMVKYPNFFNTHSVSFASEDKGEARKTMGIYFLHMKKGLLEALNNDKAVRENAFDETFTPSEFIDFILSAILSLLMQGKSSCAVLIEMICRALY